MRHGWWRLALPVMVSSCGAGAKPAPTVVIPEQAPPASIAVAATDAGAEGAPALAKPHALPAGSDGPGDAVGMIGEAGRIFPESATTVMLTNNAAMRAHPLGPRLMQLITTVLIGWDLFMPVDLVPPARDLEWVMLGGTLVLGSTRSAVFVSRYNVSEPAADAVSAELMKRLGNAKKTQLGVAGVKSFNAVVDRAERAYIRPQTGILAIVPSGEGQHTAEVLAKASIPNAVRPGELVRVSWPRAMRVAFPLPHAVSAVRVWITGGAKDDLTIAAEGDCNDGAAALEAVDELRDRLRSSAPSGFARAMMRPFVDDAAIWADGKVVRYEAKLPEPMLDAMVTFMCMRSPGQGGCTK
jgi:hypothetical protein